MPLGFGDTSLDRVHCETLARLGVAPVLVGLLVLLAIRSLPTGQGGPSGSGWSYGVDVGAPSSCSCSL